MSQNFTGQNAQTFFVTGPSSNGALIQMAACGIMTALLTSTPSMTFFRFRYMQYTNFAMLSVVQPFDGTVAFGNTTTTKLQKVGDLLYFLYVVLQIPGIMACPPRVGGCGPTQQFPYALDSNNPCSQVDAAYFATVDGGGAAWLSSNYGCCGEFVDDCAFGTCGTGAAACDTDPFVYWTNAIGQFIIKAATIIIGNQTVDTMYNDYLFMWEELAGKPGKRLNEMVGKFYCREELIAASQCTRTLYVPLPFYFTQTPGNALPLVAVMFSGVQLVIEFEQLINCIVSSGPGVQPVLCNGGGPIGFGHLRAAIDGTQIILDIMERDRFATTWFDQLITQVQALYTSSCCQVARIPIAFGTFAVEFFWAVRRKCQENANNWFNYSGIGGKDPIIAAEIDINNTPRQAMREATWYRLVQPYQFHTLIPEAFIYNYSFALYPEEAQPSGGINLARMESATLVLQLQDGLAHEDVTIIVFSRGLNLLKFREGVASLVLS